MQGGGGQVREAARLEADTLRQRRAQILGNTRQVGVLGVPGSHAGDPVPGGKLVDSLADRLHDPGVGVTEQPRLPIGPGILPHAPHRPQLRAGTDERRLDLYQHLSAARRRDLLLDEHSPAVAVDGPDPAL